MCESVTRDLTFIDRVGRRFLLVAPAFLSVVAPQSDVLGVEAPLAVPALSRGRGKLVEVEVAPTNNRVKEECSMTEHIPVRQGTLEQFIAPETVETFFTTIGNEIRCTLLGRRLSGVPGCPVPRTCILFSLRIQSSTARSCALCGHRTESPSKYRLNSLASHFRG